MWARIILLFCVFASIFMPALLDEEERAAKLESIQDCTVLGGEEIIITYQVDEIRDQQVALTAIMDISMEITKSFTYEFVINKWVSGEWQQRIYSKDGPFCSDFKEYLSELWFRVQEVTNWPDDCPITMGEYVLTDFELDAADVKLPGTMDGKLQLVFRLFNEEDENVLCKEIVALIE